jgi:hypothetical protein
MIMYPEAYGSVTGLFVSLVDDSSYTRVGSTSIRAAIESTLGLVSVAARRAAWDDKNNASLWGIAPLITAHVRQNKNH